MLRALVVAIVLLLTAGASTAAAADRIAYAAGGSIHVIRSDGTDAATLAGSAAQHPEWSPDGKKILFIRDFDVWVMNADGTDPQVVISTAHPAAILGAVWSPDGSRFAYADYNLTTGSASIKTAAANGTDVKPVTSELPHDGRLSWSPGGLIVYTNEVAGGVRTVPATGGTPTTILDRDVLAGFHPRWSPSGNRIAFLGCELSACNNDIWVMDANGGNRQRLTDHSNPDIGPSWSGDGSQIAWARNVPGIGGRLHVMDADGSNETEVTGSVTGAQFSSWEPLPDADGDGLLDTWETNGVDTDGDAVIDLDLPAMGADADHKDIFIEVDSMTGHAPSNSTMQLVVAAFAGAKVPNPDGVEGIDVHIDSGATAEMDPDTGTSWGSLSDAASLTHSSTLGTSAGTEYHWTAFNTLRSANFQAARREVFHYAISAHKLGSLDWGGISRNDEPIWNASDFIVTLPDDVFASVDPADQLGIAGTFMHELGHNLGLRHGGADHINHKPAYLSVMNYNFQFALGKTDGTRYIDYSRHTTSFNEAALNETTGAGFGGDVGSHLTIVRCPDASQDIVGLGTGTLDWNCNGTLDAGLLALDVNADGAISQTTAQIDWDTLVYAGGSIGAGAAAPPETTSFEEPTVAELDANRALLEEPLRAAPVAPDPGPGAGGGSGSGTGATPGAGSSQASPPVLTALRIRPGRFRSARRGPALVRRGGARLTFALSSGAEVVFRVRRRSGARVPGSFRVAGVGGQNVVRFSGRIGKRRLRPGRYRLLATPAGGTTVRVAFTIKR